MKRINSRSLVVIVLAFTFALAQSAPALAQATGNSNSSITGHVKDPQGASLPGATVTLYARERTFRLSTTTDSTGTYRFERLAPGEYLIEAEAEGFASARAQRVLVERGQVVTLDIPLELAGVRSTVVVTASDTPQSVDEVSKAVTVVDRQEIDERDESAIAESLRTVPGLRVQQLGGPGSFTSIKITRPTQRRHGGVD
jgi:iron complex outermembrane receptor protein